MEKRYKLSLENFAILQSGKVVTNDKGEPVLYNIKEPVVNMLFNPQLHLNMRDAIRNDTLAKKIESSNKEILFTKDEADIIHNAFESFAGFGRFDVELVRRIESMPEVDVTVNEKE